MAQPQRPGQDHEHLDASGPRDVVFCHQCENEWYQDQHGLVCPRCEGEITEIITPESDPRPSQNAPQPPPDLFHHNPWADGDSDPEEADIEEHITHGPRGTVMISRTYRSSPRLETRRQRGLRGSDHPEVVMNDFQNMLGNLMGPGFRQGPAGRSGRAELFPPLGGLGQGSSSSPRVLGGSLTFTTGAPGLQPRSVPGLQQAGPVDITSVIEQLFNQMGARAEDGTRDGVNLGFGGLFASLLNPANARRGDAVYTQEALDQIISNLMEQHPTSNAPGPASPEAIAALPRRNLDEVMLGPEGRGECSVCMDDVFIGEEVVVLPCNHWFHEACASAWLREHNTCPICRQGINAQEHPDASDAGPSAQPAASSQPTPPADPSSSAARAARAEAAAARNEARLHAIRSSAGLAPESSSSGRTRRFQVIGGDQRGNDDNDATNMPGSFSRRDSERSDTQRESRRGHTSGSDASRESRRSSQSGNGGSSGGGPLNWIRDRLSRPD